MGAIVKKYQKCGKNNCKCANGLSDEDLHGPYYWHVKYMKPRNSLRKGKYKWIYIGKTSDELQSFLQEHQEIHYSENE